MTAATRNVVTASPVSKPQTTNTIAPRKRCNSDLGVCRLGPIGQYVPLRNAIRSMSASAIRPPTAMRVRPASVNPQDFTASPASHAMPKITTAPAMNASANSVRARAFRPVLDEGAFTKGPRVP